MKVQKKDSSLERKLVTAMITSKEVLAQISAVWIKEGLFKNQWSNLVGGWCVKHFIKYGKCPGRDIESVYERWANNGADKATSAIVEKFLSGLSGEYESKSDKNDPKYLLDLAEEHFNQVAAARFKESFEEDLDDGKTAQAYSKAYTLTPIKMGESATVNVLTDSSAIRRAFEAKPEPIITFRGALGQFFGNVFSLNSFVSFVGPEKSGKSFVLLDVAWRAMLQRRRTAYYIIGDMSEEQVMQRLLTRAAGRPLWPTKKNRPVKYPTSITHEPGDKYATIDIDEREYTDELTWREALKQMKKVIKEHVKSDDPMLQLKCYPGGSINVLGIESSLATLDRQGWSPQCVVVDYADNIAPIDGKIDTRHQIDATWMALRGITQKRNCLLVTATQSNAAGYGAYLLTKKHFSESKRKNAHVTAMIGINQHEEEQTQDLLRYNMIALRGEEASVSRCCFVASCRSIANINVRSSW